MFCQGVKIGVSGRGTPLHTGSYPDMGMDGVSRSVGYIMSTWRIIGSCTVCCAMHGAWCSIYGMPDGIMLVC